VRTIRASVRTASGANSGSQAIEFAWAWSFPKTGTHFSGSCLICLGMIFPENRYPLFGIMPYAFLLGLA
jgi:hypothetical protein